MAKRIQHFTFAGDPVPPCSARDVRLHLLVEHGWEPAGYSDAPALLATHRELHLLDKLPAHRRPRPAKRRAK